MTSEHLTKADNWNVYCEGLEDTETLIFELCAEVRRCWAVIGRLEATTQFLQDAGILRMDANGHLVLAID